MLRRTSLVIQHNSLNTMLVCPLQNAATDDETELDVRVSDEVERDRKRGKIGKIGKRGKREKRGKRGKRGKGRTEEKKKGKELKKDLARVTEILEYWKSKPSIQ